MNTSEVLNKAADLIEERGWGQGPYAWGGLGKHLCLEGGLMAAVGIGMARFDYECPAYTAVASYLDRNPQPPRCPIQDTLWQWNDAPERTAAEVIETLRAAALIEAAKETDVRVVSPRVAVS